MQDKTFLIDHIDPLGQGVYKKDDQIYFIPKTLPAESGKFRILKKKKGVHFASYLSLDKKSNLRIDPQCPHFEHCPGCQFLHTDYKSEINFKKQSFYKLIKNAQIEYPPDKINIIDSSNRLHYRNRIQLHYNLKAKVIGFIDGKLNKIISVPNCKITNTSVQKKFQALLKDNRWLEIAKTFKQIKGHVEIYDTQSGVKVSWNEAYAAGGFSQVNEPVNQKMHSYLKSSLNNTNNRQILDLFGGNGNLTNSLEFSVRTCIDIYPSEYINSDEKTKFININLFDDDSLDQFKQKSLNQSFDTLVIDPPRAGFKNIQSWVDHFLPNELIYISCHPHTMIRDIKGILDKYVIEDVTLIDLFPSTYHYEGYLKLKKKK